MKQLIIPLAIIVALIVFFFVADRKEFIRYIRYETESVNVVKTANETKTVKSKPAEKAENNPVAENKPDEMKPAVETKTDQSVEAQPVTEAKSEEKPVPTAVPVVTAEEAEKRNAEALAEYDILEKKRDVLK